MNGARERILQNLRKDSAKALPTSLLPEHRDSAIYRNFDFACKNPLEAFAQKIAALRGEFYRVENEQAAAKILRKLLRHSISAARHHHSLLDRIFDLDRWLVENVQVVDHQKISSLGFADFQIGITAVDFLIARTGSIVLSAATAGGRRLSVLPPFHIAIATREQWVVSLDEALKIFRERGEAERSSYATIITGPSRTSDIEKILVLGAHGPKRLAVIVVGEKAT